MNQRGSGDQRITFIGLIRNMQMRATQCYRSVNRQDPGIESRHYMALVAWAKSVIAPRMFISAITLKELETGVLRIERRDPVQGKVLRTWHHICVSLGFAKFGNNVGVE